MQRDGAVDIRETLAVSRIEVALRRQALGEQSDGCRF
jgi:hypothetical protein